MAESLKYTPRPSTPEETLAAAQRDHADALQAGMELLTVLHRHGLLEAASKVVRGGQGLSGEALALLERGTSTLLIRNLLEAARMLSDLDPENTATLGRAITNGLNEGAARVAREEQVGLGELLGLLKDPDVQVALSAMVGILKGFGHTLRLADERQHAPASTRRTTGEDGR